jgi:hypothetical protein
MSASLLQLKAIGTQDEYLIGNPDISFFKKVYRRHTNFSLETSEITSKTLPSTSSHTMNFEIAKYGDLLSNLVLEITLPKISTSSGSYLNWTNNTGHAYIKECKISIGDKTIDKHNSVWLDIWNELTDYNLAQYQMLNKHKSKNTYLKNGGLTDTDKDLKLYVPLQFWFCRNVGLSIPLICLNHSTVKVNVTFRSIQSIINTNSSSSVTITGNPSIKLYGDYIFLDENERRTLANKTELDYLIEQVQYTKISPSTDVKLNFTKPIKNILWVFRNNNVAKDSSDSSSSTRDATLNTTGTMNNYNDYFNYMASSTDTSEIINGTNSYEPFSNFKLKLNNTDKFPYRPASYFRTVQSHFAGFNIPSKHIYLYSFALDSMDSDPTGAINFSKIDHVNMNFDNISATSSDTTMEVYVVNYNILRIKSGYAGLLTN